MSQQVLNTSASGVIGASGTAVVRIGPQIAREQWNITTTTVTGLGMTVTVAYRGQTVVDSTANDPRPTVTDNTPFLLMNGNQLEITWSGGTPGTSVTVTVYGTRRIGGDVVHAV